MLKQLVNTDFSDSKYYVDNNNIYIKKTYRQEGDYRERINLIKESDSKFLKRIINVTYEDNYTSYFEEYVDGQDLGEIDFTKFSIENITSILIQTLIAIRDLHQLNIIHRDIKPQNILLDRNLFVTLIDYDVIREDTDNTRDTKLVATFGYGSPEHFGIGSTDAQSDIYSFGKTFITLLDGISHPYTKIFEKCVLLDKENRYESVDDILNILYTRQHFPQIRDKNYEVANTMNIISVRYNLVANIIIFCIVFSTITYYNYNLYFDYINAFSATYSTLLIFLVTLAINRKLYITDSRIRLMIRILYLIAIFSINIMLTVLVDVLIVDNFYNNV